MKKHLTFKDYKSDKFWRIELKEKSFTVTYGKIVTAGQTSPWDFLIRIFGAYRNPDFIDVITSEVNTKRSVRYFILYNESRHQFWNIEISKKSIALKMGNVGRDGESSRQDFDTVGNCLKAVEKMINTQLKQGYVEVQEDIIKKADELEDTLWDLTMEYRSCLSNDEAAPIIARYHKVLEELFQKEMRLAWCGVPYPNSSLPDKDMPQFYKDEIQKRIRKYRERIKEKTSDQ